MIQHIRLRAPKEHGESLQMPRLSEVPAVWQSNPNLSLNLGEARIAAQQELAELALAYTRTYSSVAELDRSAPIVFAGHQPALFHCGVWFKNYALSSVAQALRATAINLVVDNDLCNADSILVPKIENGANGKIDSARLKRLPVDAPAGAVAYENRYIENESLFTSFADRTKQAIGSIVGSPIAGPLWQEVIEVFNAGERRLGHCLAAGRHRLEQSAGLKTLELPISLLANSNAFQNFACELIERRVELQKAYNESLWEYRVAHSIRSSAHPVPELETDEDWTEVPFWVWQSESPLRKRLFVRGVGSNLELTDRDQWTKSIAAGSLKAWLESTTACIRPRALTTTMFCRAHCGSLFLHGIGGAKYDQLNDAIIEKFFGDTPPSFLTLTATMHLPINFNRVTSEDLTKLSRQMRDLRFHPEQFVSDDAEIEQQTQELLAEKRSLIAEANSPAAANSRKKRHHAIDTVNRKLQDAVSAKKKQLAERQSLLAGQLRTSQILSSREFSFALFPESTIDRLKEMAM